MSGPSKKGKGSKALTSIPKRIHCGATEEPDPDTDIQEELDEIEINNFVNALAEVAMAVTARRLAKNKDAA